MRNYLPLLSIVIVLSAFLSSCSVEKRVYMPGYSVQWNSKAKPVKSINDDRQYSNNENSNASSVTEQVVNSESEVTAGEEVVANDLLASNSEEFILGEKESVIRKFNKASASKSDNVITSNGNVKKANAKFNLITKLYPLFAKNKLAGKESKSNNRKSQLVALLLCAFAGGLGIHRFYLGYIGIGIIQLLTAGGCGIWWLIDLIRIIIGDLGPKDGRYTDTF
jgi:TM2 domain-containing membrane protein YozV